MARRIRARYRPALPANEKRLWIELLHLDLEAHPPQAAIVSLTLTAEPGDTGKVQLGLFSPQLPESARLDVTLARVRAIVGEENVGRVVLRDTHRADGFGLEPFIVPSLQAPEITSAALRPAMRQLRPPETILVTLASDRPKAFVFREGRYAVEHAYGPWSIGGDWWGRAPWGREQWDLAARAQDGTLLCCCLVRDLMQDLWQMVALYD